MPVPGTITRVLDAIITNENSVMNVYYTTTQEILLKKVDDIEESQPDSRPSELRKLYASMEQNGITGFKRSIQLTDFGPVRRAITESSVPVDTKAMEASWLRYLFGEFKKYRTPADYMERVYKKFAAEDDQNAWEGDSLRLRLLRLFIKYGGRSLAKVGFGGYQALKTEKGGRTPEEVAANLDEQVIDELLDRATPDQLKPTGKYGVLKTVKDLAEGNFRTQGATRKALYVLAVMLGMKYVIAADGEDETALTGMFDADIEKYLFQDYYNENLLRFLCDSYRENPGAFERYPSGQGINYRNFAEMCYLYYLARDGFTPAEKLEKIGTMIEEIKGKMTRKGAPAAPAEIFQVDDVLRFNEELFKAWLEENLVCDVYVPNGGKSAVGEFQLGQNQDAAFAKYQEVLADIPSIAEATCVGLFLGIYRDGTPESFAKILDTDDITGAENFLTVLKSVDEILRDGNLLRIDSADKMSRTALLATYYHYYQGEPGDLASTWNDFAYFADPVLKGAGYQGLDSKRIFDVLLVFSLYAIANL